jgi:hypothetical protein
MKFVLVLHSVGKWCVTDAIFDAIQPAVKGSSSWPKTCCYFYVGRRGSDKFAFCTCTASAKVVLLLSAEPPTNIKAVCR